MFVSAIFWGPGDSLRNFFGAYLFKGWPFFTGPVRRRPRNPVGPWSVVSHDFGWLHRCLGGGGGGWGLVAACLRETTAADMDTWGVGFLNIGVEISPKMDGENIWKIPYFKWDDLGGFYPPFKETSIYGCWIFELKPIYHAKVGPKYYQWN